MVSKTRVREILNKPKLTDEQAERIRNDTYALAEIFVEELLSEGGSNKKVWVIDTPPQKSNDGR